jgi:hypothetical protein
MHRGPQCLVRVCWSAVKETDNEEEGVEVEAKEGSPRRGLRRIV